MTEAGLQSGVDPSAAGRRDSSKRLSSIQLMLAVALTIGLILALNFSSRIQLDRDLGRIHDEFASEIESLLAEQKKLAAELNYVKSDAYVEYWARDEGKMIREGEFLILPQGVGVESAAPAPARRLVEFETTKPEPKNWELWWALFSDDRLPSQ